MPKIVPDDGTGRERIVICGEMPAQAEEQLGRPLVGPSGQLMMRMMREAGIERRDCYITNVIPWRDNPKNDVKLVNRAIVEEQTRALHQRLAKLYDPWLIVPLGNTALRALTGKVGIVKHRGSIYEYADERGRRIKVIPTIHTAALFRQPSWERRCRLDWKRIASDRQFRELRLPDREHRIEPTFNDVCDFVEDARQHAEVLVIDIETPFTRTVKETTLKSGKPGKPKFIKGPRRMTVFGASYDPSFGFVIPTTEEYWERRGVPLEKVMDQIRELCALPCEKGGQSAAGFDRFWLHWYGIPVTNYMWDTRWMSHAIDPLDDHALAYQASIWTREPYWKDDGKEDDTDIEGAYDIKDYWRYNSKDAAVERELVDVHHSRFGKRLSYYLRRYVPLFDPMLHISVGGMRVDAARRARMYTRYLVEQIETQDKLTKLAGAPLYGAKGSLSSKKLQTFLYETLRLPPQKDRKTGSITTKEVTVRRLMLKYPAKLGADKEPDAAGSLILRHRRLEAVKRFTHSAIPDEDGYRRSQYGFTYTLRFTAGKNPRHTGNNSQNDDREILGMFVPDNGHIFVEVDLSQAEDRVVKVLAAGLRSTLPQRREELLWRARAMPWENDEHKRAAMLLNHIKLEEVTKEQRYLAKRARHASNYGMMGKTLSEQFLKDGYVFPPEECDTMISTILDKDAPEVRDWQRWVRQTTLRDKHMTNGWGSVVDVRYERFDDNLYRKMYAYQPQCCDEATEVLTNEGFVPFPMLKDSMYVAQWEPERSHISFIQPQAIHTATYHGDMLRGLGQHVNMLVTPNHRIVHGTKTWNVHKAEELVHKVVHVPTSGIKPSGGHIMSRAVVQLLVATQADGCLKRESGNDKVEWHFIKPRKIARLRQLLRRAGVFAREFKGSDGSVTFTASGTWPLVMREWLPNKRFDYRMLDLSPYLRAVLVRETALWDSRRNSRGGSSWSYLTTDRHNAEVIQSIAIVTGFSATLIQESPSTNEHAAVWRLNLTRGKETPLTWVNREKYDGVVYCVTVPTGFFIARRGGAVFVTGNSEVTGIIKYWGLVPLLEVPDRDFRVCNEKHDSLLISVPPEKAYRLMLYLRQCLQRSRVYNGVELMIPCEFKIGMDASMPVEFKKFPSREEFEESANALKL